MEKASLDKPADPDSQDEIHRRVEELICSNLGEQLVFSQNQDMPSADSSSAKPHASQEEPGGSHSNFI